MGCTSALNRQDEDENRIIRLDIGTIKSTSTPKNEINLMKLTEQLLQVLKQACGEDLEKYEKFNDLIVNNTTKLDEKLDEVTYVLSISKQQISLFQQNAAIIHLCHDVVAHLDKMLELNLGTFKAKDEWYYKYSYALITEVAQFKPVLSLILEKQPLKEHYQSSKEILMLYACIIGVIRFLEGISWGYSVFLMHQALDQENSLSAKVLFNLMMRLKQHFKENREFTACFTDDKPAFYYSSYYFKNSLSYNSLEKIICEPDKQDDRKSIFLNNQVFRKSYISVKKQIDEWLRVTSRHSDSINVAELKKYKEQPTFLRQNLREMKFSKQITPIEIDNSQNFMILRGEREDSIVVLESFLQANVRSRTKYKCCALHHCMRENKLSMDTYYIVKNIILSILNSLPSLYNYILLQEHNFVKEFLEISQPEKLDLQQDYAETFVKFCKVLKELKLDFNVVIVITGLETLWKQSKMTNLVYILRACSLYLPNFLKFVLSVDPRSGRSQKGEEIYNKILSVLGTQTIVIIDDSKINTEESQSYLDFALTYSTDPKQVQPSQETISKMTQIALQKSNGEYRKVIEIVKKIQLLDQKTTHDERVKSLQNLLLDEDSILNAIKEIQTSQNSQFASDFLSALLSLNGPIHLDTFYKIMQANGKQNSESQLQTALIQFASTLNLTNSVIQRQNQKATSIDYFGNKKTILTVANKTLLKKLILTLDASIYNKKSFSEQVVSQHQKEFEKKDQETEFEELDAYQRLYILNHIAKSGTPKFSIFEQLFSAKNIYKAILYHRSYNRYRERVTELIIGESIDKEEKVNLVNFCNILHLIEQTIKAEPLNYLDFCTQLRGRILGEHMSEFMMDLRLDITSENICYFKNMHHALRENPRIDTILKFPNVQVLRIKFMSDKKRVLISLACGLILLYNIIEYKVEKVLTSKVAILDCVKVIEDKYMITGGLDSKTRIWNLETEKLISKFEIHSNHSTLMVTYKEFIFSFGSDNSLTKFNFKAKTIEKSLSFETPITSMKIIKTVDESMKLKLAVVTQASELTLYDLSLNLLKQVSLKTANEDVIRIICLSNTEFLTFTNVGNISVWNNQSLEETKNASIFSLKSEDYIDLILIKSREFFLFTLEKQKIEFYSATTFKRTDSWEYFFERDLIASDKNKEGSKIFVTDKQGYTTLFNFLKHLDQSPTNFVPCNRRYDPVVSLESTERLETNTVISCSQDRDLRVWRKDNGVFIKKYDLSSFTGENITAMRLGKDENLLFLGSKDMNVYLIDIGKGKLCVVYEGHWNRVTEIYTIPNKDILITLSESNIKVWDLEYDECIKNMNDHNSSIVYIAQHPNDENQVMTIASGFEFKTWQYVTGQVNKSHEIQINKDQRQLKNLSVVCCDVSSELAYIGLNTSEICVYSIEGNKVLHSFKAYNQESLISLKGIQTQTAKYVVVTTRTSCILYLVQTDQVKRLCSYLVNARKKPNKKKHDNKYSYNVRFYFTSARIVFVGPQGSSIQASPIARAKGPATPLEGPDSTMNMGPHTKVGAGVDDESQPLISSANPGQQQTNIVDTMGTKIRDTVALVILGDSRGFVHMNHLILK